MKKQFSLFLFLILGLGININAQETAKTQELNSKGQAYLVEHNYEKAIKTFQKVLDMDNENMIAIRSIAYAYDLSEEFELADIMYDKFLELFPNQSRLAYFEAGKAKFNNGNYVSALSYLAKFDSLQTEPNYKFGRLLEQELPLELNAREELNTIVTECQIAMDIQQFSTMEDVINIGRNINTPADEYFPYLTNDRELIFYTRRKDKFADENLFYSEKQNQQWDIGKSVGMDFNTLNNEGMSTILRNGRKLFFTSCERPSVKGPCDLWTADLNGHKISNIESLQGESNSDYWESQATISCDGDVIYFASNRPGGLGGSDIWMSILDEEGNWTEPVNMGPQINTTKDEEAPFISNDSRTLFFSSTGHPGLGEQDMFLSKMDKEGNWQKPVNLGPPINSSYRELGFYLSSNGTTGYFASNREHPQAAGGMDIYSFELPKVLNADPVTYVELTVIDSLTKRPVICDVFTQEEGRLSTDSEGRVFICSPANTSLNLTILQPSYNAYTRTINIPEWDNSILFSILLPLQPEEGREDRPVLGYAETKKEKMHQIYFGFNKKKMDGLEKEKLDQFLQSLPNRDEIIEIEIKGFSDQTGDDLYNLKLSEERADAVATFMKNKGYRVDRVFIEGGGEIMENIPDREKRRVEIKIYH